jgi:hypothetical protein
VKKIFFRVDTSPLFIFKGCQPRDGSLYTILREEKFKKGTQDGSLHGTRRNIEDHTYF